jgi:hypothetical protein
MQIAELDAQRRQLRRQAATVAADLRCAKRRRSKIMEKARNLTPHDLAQLLAEKTAAQEARPESYADTRGLHLTVRLTRNHVGAFCISCRGRRPPLARVAPR